MALRQLFPSSSLQPQLEAAEQLTQLQVSASSAKQLPQNKSEAASVEQLPLVAAASAEQLPPPKEVASQSQLEVVVDSLEQVPQLRKQHDSPRPSQKSSFSSSGLLSSHSYPSFGLNGRQSQVSLGTYFSSSEATGATSRFRHTPRPSTPFDTTSVRLRTDWAVPVSQPSHSDRATSQPAHCDRLLRSFRSLAMEGLVQDFNMALDDTAAGSQSSERSAGGRRKAWKRRCKSTSNLVSLAAQNVSDDSSSSLDNVGLLSRDRGTSSLQLSDSDPEGVGGCGVGGCCGVVGGTGSAHPSACNRRNKLGSHKAQDHQRRRVILDPFTLESDSFTENISPYKEFRVHSKRKRKSKRMAVDQSSENVKPVIQTGFVFRSPGQGGTKRKKVRSRSGCDGFLTGKKSTSGITPGKRKRSAREKSVDHNLSETGKEREDRMDCDDVSGSSLSSSEWEDLGSDLSHGDNDGREADDEQSDWPGPEPAAMSVMQLTDEEIDSEVTFNVNTTRKGTLTRRSFTAREIKAGARRLRTQRTIPTVEGGRRLTLPEIIARFIQDPSMNSLCIPLPVRSSQSQEDRGAVLRSHPTEDRGTVLRLASLYSLSWTQEETNSIVISKNVHITEPAAEFVVPGIPRTKDIKKFDPKRQKKLCPQQTPMDSSCRISADFGSAVASTSSSSNRTRRKSGSKSS